MRELLSKEEFNFISADNKEFIVAFDDVMNKLGYTCGNNIGGGYCWGKYMIIYTKADVRSKKSYARVYIRDEDIVLRLYLSNVDKHSKEIEQAPAYIQEAFIGDYAACDHCHGKTECVHQKSYTIHGQLHVICDGKAFWFFQPDITQMAEYLKLFIEFYLQKRRRNIDFRAVFCVTMNHWKWWW